MKLQLKTDNSLIIIHYVGIIFPEYVLIETKGCELEEMEEALIFAREMEGQLL